MDPLCHSWEQKKKRLSIPLSKSAKTTDNCAEHKNL